MGNEKGYFNAILFHIFLFSMKAIHFLNGIIIMRIKCNPSILNYFLRALTLGICWSWKQHLCESSIN
jgi:hypothetical protein